MTDRPATALTEPVAALAVRPDALLLDFGGVVFETEKRPDGRRRAAELVRERLSRAGHEVTTASLLSSIEAGLGALKHWKHAMSRTLVPVELTHRALWEDFLLSDQPAAVRAVAAGDGRELMAAINPLLSDHRVRPGAAELLRLARGLGVRVGIVSNAHSGLSHRNLMRRFGLDVLVDVQLYSDEVGIRKPHPDMIRRAAAALGTVPERCWYVGDTQDRDVQAGRRAGAGGVVLTRSKHTDTPPFPVAEKADAVFDTPEGLIPVLAGAAEAGAAVTGGGSDQVAGAVNPTRPHSGSRPIPPVGPGPAIPDGGPAGGRAASGGQFDPIAGRSVPTRPNPARTESDSGEGTQVATSRVPAHDAEPYAAAVGAPRPSPEAGDTGPAAVQVPARGAEPLSAATDGAGADGLPSRPRALLLDQGGVLVTSVKTPEALAGFVNRTAARLRAAGHPVTDLLMGDALAYALDAYRAAKRTPESDEDGRSIWREITPAAFWGEHAAAALPVSARDWLLAEAVALTEEYARAKSRARLREGVTGLLEWCRTEGIAVGIVSNTICGREGRRRLADAGVAELIGANAYSDEVGRRKPDPALVLAASRALGVDPGECWFVGDKPWRDVRAARAAGVGTAVIVEGGSPSAPELAEATGADRPDLLLPSMSAIHEVLVSARPLPR
ncbi:HAD family hydrolase [Glycomyces paridis]|uniref:HAD family hydrolase n=1 Tax=Glycomyces paridis TaxID=2126555 RepID=UPI0019596714|nr:HAD family hydrolase [Glycomyces paridis]